MSRATSGFLLAPFLPHPPIRGTGMPEPASPLRRPLGASCQYRNGNATVECTAGASPFFHTPPALPRTSQGGVDAVNQLVCCVCCMLIIGPLLAIIGVMFLISALSDTRGDLINEYNTFVPPWTNGSYAEFKTAEFGLRYEWTSGCNAGAVDYKDVPLLPGAATPNDVYTDNDSKLLPYEQWKYTDNADNDIPSAVYASASSSCRLVYRRICPKPQRNCRAVGWQTAVPTTRRSGASAAPRRCNVPEL
mmetsp:Transcript_37490/g.118231  ORF Transcript_37490/g.118231 Transcript_37490/m.118231 type:complete len:248 (+) Transcript_37490:287-1030(+)